jgi:hypothetical protein
MANSPLLKKLGVKPGYRLLVLNAPDGYLDQLAPLPEKAELATKGKGPFDVVQLFVKNKAQVDRDAAKAIGAVKPRGLLWIAYPKKSSKIETDISRDVGWETMKKADWEGVAIFAIDDTWSALRFRPAADVGT